MIYKHLLNFWPLVPAVDIVALYETLKTDTDNSDDFDIPFSDYKEKHILPNSVPENRTAMNILIITDGIGCLFKSIARMYRHKTKQLNIYVISNFPESLARILFLLSVFNEPSDSIGNLEKAEIFLEVFGNTFVRASTAAYVETKSARLLEDIVSGEMTLRCVPMVSIDFLKQRQKDEVCNVLSYLKDYKTKFDAGKAWETSLRAYYGSRYDNRRNLFDYLYNMKLSQYPVIGLQEYLEWCESGTAFKLRKGRYDHPNKTLCLKNTFTGTESDYYCGDIATSPYISFGVECKNEKMFEKVNNQYTHTSKDISKFNIIDYMTEISSNPDMEKNLNVFLCLFSTFKKSNRFEHFFDAVYVTCDMTSYAENGTLEKCLKNDGVVIFETMVNVINSTKERKTKHSVEIVRLAKLNNLEAVEISAVNNGCFKTFVMKGNV